MPANLSFFDREPLLRMIATAIVRLSTGRAWDGAVPVYEDAVQSAFNHLVLLCLRRNVAPPASVPEMVRWAAKKPLRAWPLDLPPDWEAADGFLVDEQTRTPTQACLEWAVSAPDAAAEQFEHRLMATALAACQAAKSPQSYTAFRRLLATRPVLTGTGLARLGGDLDLSPLYEVIKQSYEPAPAALVRGGTYAVCARCRCLLVPIKGGRFKCELDRCRRDRPARVGETLEARHDGVYQLSRPLRVFITGPGLAEVDLEAALVKLGLVPEMWPNYDAYDLRITLPDGRVWAVDVKDWANPALLGRAARPLRPAPPYDRAFLVVPGYRFDEREDYRRVFNCHRPGDLEGRLELVSDEELLRMLRAELARVPGTSAPAQARVHGA